MLEFFMLIDTIREDMKTAMKARDALKVQCLRGAMTAATNELVAQGRKPTDTIADAEVIMVLKRLAKQRKDSADQFTSGNRLELAEKEIAELRIIEAYLPATASLAEIESVVREKMQALNVTDVANIGKLTGIVMKEFALRESSVDGTDVKKVIEAIVKKTS